MKIDKQLLGAAAGALLEVKAVRTHGSAPVVKPSEVLPEVDGPVMVDTEGSGLHVDDGARPSVVIVAWEEEGIERSDRGDGWRVRSYAFPFDQCTDPTVQTNKYHSGQLDLLGSGGIGEDGEDAGLNLELDEYLWLLEWIKRRTLVVMHNAKHDLHQFRVGPRRWSDVPEVRVDLSDHVQIWDTMVVNKELWPLEMTGLEASCNRLRIEVDGGGGKAATGDPVKEWLKKRGLPAGRYDLVPWDILAPYGSSDGELTTRLYRRQVEEIVRRLMPRNTAGEVKTADDDGGESATGTYESADDYELRNRGLQDWMIPRENRFMRVLYKMETRGLPFDTGACLEAAAQLEESAAKIAAGLPYDPSSDRDVKRYYFARTRDGGVLGLVPYAVTAKRGDPQLTEEVVRKMVRDDVPYAQELAEYNKIQTALEMWYRAYPSFVGEDGRLRTSFKQTFVRSGRLSVERFQAQALPHDHRLEIGALREVPTVRSLVGAGVPAGWTLWEIDLAQAELRVAAISAGCDKMVGMLEGGIDAHGETARELFRVDRDDASWFNYRQVAKRGNFSFCFGVGPDTFKATIAKLLGIEIPLSECERIVQSWNRLYPEFRGKIYEVMRLVRSRQERYGNGWVRLINGKRRWFEIYEETHKAFNQYVQASLAELGKDWSIWTEQTYPGNLLLTVHDSQVLMVPESTGDEIPQAVAAAAARMGTDMFGVKMECDVKPWNVH